MKSRKDVGEVKYNLTVIAPDISPNDKQLEYALKKAMLLSLAEKGTITLSQYEECIKLIKK